MTIKYYRVIYKDYSDVVEFLYTQIFFPNKKQLKIFTNDSIETKQIFFVSKKKYTKKEFENFHVYYNDLVEECYVNNKIVCLICEEEVDLDQKMDCEDNIQILGWAFNQPDKFLCFCSEECCNEYMNDYYEDENEDDYSNEIDIYDENSEFFVGYGSI